MNQIGKLSTSGDTNLSGRYFRGKRDSKILEHVGTVYRNGEIAGALVVNTKGEFFQRNGSTMCALSETETVTAKKSLRKKRTWYKKYTLETEHSNKYIRNGLPSGSLRLGSTVNAGKVDGALVMLGNGIFVKWVNGKYEPIGYIPEEFRREITLSFPTHIIDRIPIPRSGFIRDAVIEKLSVGI